MDLSSKMIIGNSDIGIIRLSNGILKPKKRAIATKILMRSSRNQRAEEGRVNHEWTWRGRAATNKWEYLTG